MIVLSSFMKDSTCRSEAPDSIFIKQSLIGILCDEYKLMLVLAKESTVSSNFLKSPICTNIAVLELKELISVYPGIFETNPTGFIINLVETVLISFTGKIYKINSPLLFMGKYILSKDCWLPIKGIVYL
eukprot:NODE_154_length_15322_cov_0.584510.p13 type:complete len:129 gc:universal NODE_154_length_15322_cov_0.584510:8841-9227(+)